MRIFHSTTREELDPNSFNIKQYTVLSLTRTIRHRLMLAHQGSEISNSIIPAKVNTFQVKDNEGQSQTTSLKVYTRDSSETHRWIPITRGSVMHLTVGLKRGPILYLMDNNNISRMVKLDKESIHSSLSNQNGSLRLQIRMLKQFKWAPPTWQK